MECLFVRLELPDDDEELEERRFDLLLSLTCLEVPCFLGDWRLSLCLDLLLFGDPGTFC